LLEKTTSKSYHAAVIRALKNFLHRPAIRMGLARNPRRRFRDPRFVSFLAMNNRKTLDTDFQDTVLRGRRVAKQAFTLLLALGGAWIVLESAKALSVF
jgi:hypothetical protein